jgi:ArsR family transcriptional regulator, arsenate/arsenite/antimonite-responsive transcriptional repressor
MKLIQEIEECCPPLRTAPLSDEDAHRVAAAFKAIADPVRLRLLSMIASCEAGEMCVCDLTEPVGLSQPTVSHHLKVLADAGILSRAKRGTWVYYRVEPDALRVLRTAIS